MVRGVTADEGRDDREEHAVSVFRHQHVFARVSSKYRCQIAQWFKHFHVTGEVCLRANLEFCSTAGLSSRTCWVGHSSSA